MTRAKTKKLENPAKRCFVCNHKVLNHNRLGCKRFSCNCAIGFVTYGDFIKNVISRGKFTGDGKATHMVKAEWDYSTDPWATGRIKA